MQGKFKTATLVAGLMTLIAATAMAQNQPGTPRQGQGQGQAQQQATQQRQMERSTDQNRAAEHARLQQRDQDRTQTHTAAAQSGNGSAGGKGIYGGNLMTEQERNQYRERLGAMKTEQERNAFMAQHQETMQKRSKERNVPIEVTSD
jgi:multidrug efflux pump subunit AcrB